MQTNLEIVQRKCGAYFGREQSQTDHDQELAIQSAGHDKSGGSRERERAVNEFTEIIGRVKLLKRKELLVKIEILMILPNQPLN